MATNPGNAQLDGHVQFRTLEAAQKDMTDLAGKIASVEQEESYLLATIGGIDNVSARESFLQDPNALEDLRRLASTAPVGDLNLGTLLSRDQWMADHDRRQMFAAAGDVTIPDTARVGRTRASSLSYGGA